jgi:hypothetical protein
MHPPLRALILALSTFLLLIPAGALAQQEDPPERKPDQGEKAAETDMKTEDDSEESEKPVEAGEAAASELDYRIDDGDLIVAMGDEEQRIETACDAPDIAVRDRRIYLSCGERGVQIVELSEATGRARTVGYQSFDGTVSGLLETEGRIWATVERIEARPVGGAAATTTTAPVATAPAEPKGQPAPESAEDPEDPEQAELKQERPVGTVVDVEPGVVIVGLGLNDGLERDGHVELFRRRSVGLGGGERATRIDTIAVGHVVAVSEKRARVELGLGERVGEDALARPTSAPLTGDPTAPQHVSGIWEASVALRPFLALRTVGAGTVSSARLIYRFESPLAVHLNAFPLSGGLAREGNVSAVGADVALAYDARIFSLGLGIGATQIGMESLGGIAIDEEGGPTITQYGRIGARDGLHLRLQNSFVVANRELFFAGADATIQVPLDSVVSNSWIVFHGGGHVGGQFLGEAGLRLLVRGNGDRGSLFVTPTVGGGLVSNEEPIPNCTADFPSDCTELVSYGGPLIGLELEWRL